MAMRPIGLVMSSLQTDYQVDRVWSDAHIEQVKKLIGPYLLEVSPFKVDTEQASDLVVLQNKSIKVACRLRRPPFAEKYGGQFTIRFHRTNRIKTEFAKIIDGWADWLFYGHVNDEGCIHAWWLLSLDIFRATLIRDPDSIRCEHKRNRDGTTEFMAYDIASFPSGLVIASSTGNGP